MESKTRQRSATESRLDDQDSVVTLYEVALRALSRAKQCTEEKDQIGRVMEVKKVTNILTHLQATLRTQPDRSAAMSLADFYAAMFTLTLEASQCESAEGLNEVIGYVSQVRDAWVFSSAEPKSGRTVMQGTRPRPAGAAVFFNA